MALLNLAWASKKFYFNVLVCDCDAVVTAIYRYFFMADDPDEIFVFGAVAAVAFIIFAFYL